MLFKYSTPECTCPSLTRHLLFCSEAPNEPQPVSPANENIMFTTNLKVDVKILRTNWHLCLGALETWMDPHLFKSNNSKCFAHHFQSRTLQFKLNNSHLKSGKSDQFCWKLDPLKHLKHFGWHWSTWNAMYKEKFN